MFCDFVILNDCLGVRASLNRTFFTSIPVFQPRNTKTCDAPFSADTPRKKILPRREAARQVFWLVPAATPSRPSRTSGFQRVAATIGTYSSGNCCRFSRHSHLITRGLARPFVNHCGANLQNIAGKIEQNQQINAIGIEI